ncbi:acyl-CoA dehydrogenase [Halobacteriales archaeon QS_9_70_65]|nr:MAG: acyl-CoA dehydrogenase [Halobacteriales archaeon QS_9_70_65]
MDPTPEQEAIRETVREFAVEEVRPTAREADEMESFPEDVWDGLADIGLTAMTVPEEYGGLDVDGTTYAVCNEELAYGQLSVATALSVHCLATSCIAEFGDDDQKERWLPEMADGRPVGAFALSEPDAGSNPAEMSTEARREGDEYVIDGTKQWITNGIRSGVVVLFAKTDPDDPGTVTQFVVPKDADGLEVGKALSILTGGRVGIAAQAVGLAQSALDAAVDYADDREQFGGAVSDIQAIRQKLAEMYTKTQAGRTLTYDAARRLDEGRPPSMAASTAKYFASEAVMDVTNEAVQIHGGYGYTTDFPVERLYRDAKITTIYEGTSQIQKKVIARELLD